MLQGEGLAPILWEEVLRVASVESVPGRWAGRKPVRVQGGEQSRLWALPPACLRPHSQGRITPRSHGQGFLSNLHFAGQFEQVTQYLCATPGHSPPTVADIQPTRLPPLLGKMPESFSKPQVNQSETVFLPILYLYGGFLLEQAFTYRH